MDLDFGHILRTSCLYNPKPYGLVNPDFKNDWIFWVRKNQDLASRDVVSRAMTLEIREGRGVGPNKDSWQRSRLQGVVEV